jgi:hypothetical protein
MRGIFWLLVGSVVFVAITFLEQIPVLGWIGGIVSIAAWIALTRGLMLDREWDPLRSGIGIAWAGLLGAVTGFVGALTAWLAQTGNLFGFTTPPGDRFGAVFGFVGALIGLVYWPLIGAIVCVVTAFVVTGRRFGSR